MVEGECILYPCYFNAGFTRAEGRRVPRSLAAKGPVLMDIERSLRKMGVTFRAEEQHHPAHWERHEGRIIAEWTDKKEILIKKVAQKMDKGR
ncbi:MAG: signal recognition particle protein Srp19 [Methanomicrobiales archaeon HGW-Methanomicrobiales-1]|jgi:signal recognition particle subunit SRP19|nr:MAG: signal recognition particle protein Srp19 [Methanomicrobiales archaeon HGW-Methanomicrobiales-1]